MTYAMRELDTFTLGNAAAEWAENFESGSVVHPIFKDRWISGRSYVMSQLYKADYLDEFEWLVAEMDRVMAGNFQDPWEMAKRKWFEPRDPALHEEILATKLAVFPDGQHIPGKIGIVEVGSRTIGRSEKKITHRMVLPKRGILEHMGSRHPKSVIVGERILFTNDYWPVYAGEQIERDSESGVADDLPEGAETWPPLTMLFTNPKMSNVVAILACDAIVDDFDSGTGAGIIRGYTGAQPADPDTAASGTLLFTLVASDPAFGAAVDDTGKATATASAITQDASADATGTVGYCRIWSTNDGATPLLSKLDGEAGASGSDFNFNTPNIVSGNTVDMTALTVSVLE